MDSEDEHDIHAQKAAVPNDETNTSNLSLIFRVKKTQIRMLEDRGYELDDVDNEIKRLNTYTEFWDYIRVKVPKLTSDPTSFWDFLSKVYTYKKGEEGQKENLVIFLPPPLGKSFPASKLNKYIDHIKRTANIGYVDIIYELPLSKNTRQKLAITNRIITSWVFSDLVSPIIDSYYVGKQTRILPESEYREIYAGSGIFKSQLPHVRRDDPVAKYWQWTPGMVIESLELGDLSVAVTHVLKHYVVTPETITEVIETGDVL